MYAVQCIVLVVNCDSRAGLIPIGVEFVMLGALIRARLYLSLYQSNKLKEGTINSEQILFVLKPIEGYKETLSNEQSY